jgi:predicted outer membrane repeat protein
MKLRTLLAVLVVLILVTSAPCSTILVKADGTGDVPDIKTGIASASPGDTVILADGIYTGRMNTDISYGGKAIVIRSQSGDPHACVIDCQGGPTNWVRGFGFYLNEGPGSVLEGVTITNGYMYEGGGIWCWNASPTISNVIFTSNVATSSGGAVYCGGTSAPVVTNITVCDNSAPEGSGVCCNYGGAPTVLNSIVAFNIGGGAVFLDDTSIGLTLNCCDIYGNVGGDWVGPIMGQFGRNGNISADPMFCEVSNPAAPYSIDSSSPCVGGGTGCGIIGACGIGCWSGVEASIDITPDVLNRQRLARWVTCYIELAEGFDPENIDITTVALNDSVFAEHTPTSVGDYDDDGVPDCMVKFSGPRVMGSIEGLGEVELTVSGQVAGQGFTGVDTVRVIARRGQHAYQAQVEENERKPKVLVSNTDGAGGRVKVEFELERPAAVKVAVYDVRGRLVRELINGTAGLSWQAIEWDGRDESHTKVSPGIYFVNLEADEYNMTRKVMIVR